MSLSKDILATVAYFDLFHHPVTQTEIYAFLQRQHSHEAVAQAVEQLIDRELLYPLDEFYSLHNDYALVRRRREGMQRAKGLLQKAEKVAAFLSRFPFVRGVAVSGSLSKNVADADADIDLFIITRRNRLWIARTLMHCFKKLTFLFNRQHYFCMNYYVDEALPEIEEKNIYTAIEVATLLPLRGIEAFEAFYRQNQWVKTHLPHHLLKPSYVRNSRGGWIRQGLELLFNHPGGDLLDRLLLRLTALRWRKKEARAKKTSHGRVMSLSASRHCAKPNPYYYQTRLMTQYHHKLLNLWSQLEKQLEPHY